MLPRRPALVLLLSLATVAAHAQDLATTCHATSSYDVTLRPDSVLFDQDGIRLVVDRKWLPFVDGTEIDFLKVGLNAQFVFKNPNATGECGCGESFTVAPAA